MSFKGGGSVATVPPLGKACVPVPRKVSVDVGLKQKEATRRCVVLRLVTGIFGRDMEPSQYFSVGQFSHHPIPSGLCLLVYTSKSPTLLVFHV